MNKKHIRYKVIGFHEDFDFSQSLLVKHLSDKYIFEESEAPDYVLYGPFSEEHLPYEEAIRIFVTGENVAPDFNLCDYALGFERMQFGDRYTRYPVYMFYDRIAESLKCVDNQYLAEARERTKTGSCSMVVSNPTRERRTIDLFHLLSAYKQVASGGRYLNNVNQPNGVENKLEFISQYKFNLAFENSSHRGYTTEKIIDAFVAGTVPVYWGDPSIKEYINPDAFLDITRCSLDEAYNRIVALDADDQAYNKMLHATPLFLCEEERPDVMFQHMLLFFEHIFEQEKEVAHRRNNGPHADKYHKRLIAWMRVAQRAEKLKQGIGYRIWKKIKYYL